jgi:hypothetical protein
MAEDPDPDDEEWPYTTNIDHPNHNADDPIAFPKTADQWDEDDLKTAQIEPSDVPDDHWVDSNGKPFAPDTGMKKPKDGRCNALCTNYEERYGERRYCGKLPIEHFTNDVDHGYCPTHEERVTTFSAEEMLQHGASSKTRDHTYRGLDAWDKLLVHGLHESLMAESTYEFAPEHEPKEFDFGDATITPQRGHIDGDIHRFQVAHATERMDRELALWAAAVDGVKMMNVNAEIAEDAMSVTSVEKAQLTSPTDADPSQTFKTIETEKEHPLNLAYSRLTRDRKELLQYGGVEIDGTTSDDTSIVEGMEALTVVNADTNKETPAKDIAREAESKQGVDLEVE